MLNLLLKKSSLFLYLPSVLISLTVVCCDCSGGSGCVGSCTLMVLVVAAGADAAAADAGVVLVAVTGADGRSSVRMMLFGAAAAGCGAGCSRADADADDGVGLTVTGAGMVGRTTSPPARRMPQLPSSTGFSWKFFFC